MVIEVRNSIVQVWRSMSFNEKPGKGKSPKWDRPHSLFCWSGIE
ncbi:aspartate kinase [Peribacillus saganii]|uniref:Aspartate kinase n=1 Tax=Peribacillus saganii TaxID=2303992 RepID=A0A372LR74_9BACI|nr:aspartate kinase [Peribacillus saganii]